MAQAKLQHIKLLVMKKREALDKILTGLYPFLKAKNFKLVKTGYSGFTRTTSNGFDWIHITCKNYYPTQIIEYYLNKRIDLIKDIMLEIYEKFFTIDPKNLKYITTIKFTYESLNLSQNSMGYLPEIVNEEDVDQNFALIEEFLLTQGLGLLDKFEDIREIDKIINREPFWTTDFQMSYMIQSFQLQRTLIAHLCQNPLLEEIKKFHSFEIRNAGKSNPRSQNLLDAYNYLLSILDKIPTLK